MAEGAGQLGGRVKPEVADGATEAHPESFNIKLVFEDSPTFFKVKPSTSLKKIRDAFCRDKRVDPGEFKLLYDGEVLQLDQTLAELSARLIAGGEDAIGEGAVFDVVVQQRGGAWE